MYGDFPLFQEQDPDFLS